MSRPPRISAAILLLRGHGDATEVLLVERAPQLRFFGGYHAFVGGVRDPIDGPDDMDGSDARALLACGVRELFEETGVLVDAALGNAMGDRRATVRAELLDRDRGQDGWGDLVAALPERHGLTELCRITTPPFAPVRYDTVFFTAELPEAAQVDIIPGELTRGSWWAPRDALAAWRRGEIAIVPPALILLELLAQAAGDRGAFRAMAERTAQAYRDGELHEVRFSPGIVLAPLATETLPPATTTNCLIVGTGALWVVDPASPDPNEQRRLFALCDKLIAQGPPATRIAGVLATHHHPDHIGAMAATCARYGVQVHGHPITLERLPSDCPHGRALDDGATIDLGAAPDGGAGWLIEALHTPGHDRGHLCFHENRYGALIAGDMVSTVSTIMIDPPEGHLRTYLESLARLASRPGVATTYPAHGPAALHGTRLLRKFIEHRAQREAQLIAALDGTPRSIDELVPKVYADTDRRAWPLAARSMLSGLEKLIEDDVAAEVAAGRFQRAAPAES